ncbi:MAG TPA: hypothetical protein EYH28_06785 [Anaerolineaceae bacterium]|nr:hypothetical protein [Anaerolineaceae bacterium]
MCKLTLNAVVTKALVDDCFREALLSGRAEAALQEFPLNEEERRLLGNIRAEDVEGLAAQIDRLIGEETRAWPFAASMDVALPAAYAVAGD